jgi:hypothetical protein
VVIEEALYADLCTTLSSLVGTRVYPDAYPQPDEGAAPPFPCAVYQRSADDRRFTLAGGRSSIRQDIYTVELWSDKRSDGWAFRELMEARYSGIGCTGKWGGASGLWVLGAVARDAQADAEAPTDGGADPDRAERVSLVITYDASR